MKHKTETETQGGHTFNFTPVSQGRYNFEGQKCLVIDPCYIIQDNFDNVYNALCRALSPTYEPKNAGKDLFIEMECDGDRAFIFGTRYGDGCYPVSQSGDLKGRASVDAGILGVFPESILHKIGASTNNRLGVACDGISGNVNHDNGNVSFGRSGRRDSIEVVTGDEPCVDYFGGYVK